MFDNDFDHVSLLSRQANDTRWGNIVQSLLRSGINRPLKGAHNDKAHPPIHPTSPGRDLSGDDLKVYEFVTRRYIACVSQDAKGLETCVKLQIGSEEFSAKGLKITALNYLEVYTYDKWNQLTINGDYRLHETIPSSTLSVCMQSGSTTRPDLLSEPELIGTMDKNQIGTDATIHEHISKILDRKYAIKTTTHRFHPTKLGVAIIESFDSITSSENSLTRPLLRAKVVPSL